MKIMADLTIQETPDGVVFSAKIVPGSSRTAVCGSFDGMVKIKVSSAPERGKANRRLVEFLSLQLGMNKSTVRIISGQTSPVKKIEVTGISAKELALKLGLNE